MNAHNSVLVQNGSDEGTHRKQSRPVDHAAGYSCLRAHKQTIISVTTNNMHGERITCRLTSIHYRVLIRLTTAKHINYLFPLVLLLFKALTALECIQMFIFLQLLQPQSLCDTNTRRTTMKEGRIRGYPRAPCPYSVVTPPSRAKIVWELGRKEHRSH